MTAPEEHHGLVNIYSCGTDEEANVIIAFLDQNGIRARLQTDLPHSVLPVSGDCELYCHEDDAEEALRLINEQLKRSSEEPAE